MIEMFSTRATWFEAMDAVRVLRGGQLVAWRNCELLESEIAAFLGIAADRVVTCGSGTSALVLAMEALGSGGKRKEVIVPAVTFSATYEAVLCAGATPVVADVDPACMTPTVDQIEAKITPNTSAVIIVHLYGWSAADTAAIRGLCWDRRIALIEDTAQAFGADLRGAKLATVGDAGAVSLYPTKPLGGVGDGGFVVFERVDDAAFARKRRDHGRHGGVQVSPGYNSRLDEVNAAVVRRRLSEYASTLSHLRALADAYDSLIGWCSTRKPIGCQPAPYVYPIRNSGRDELREHLKASGIETRVHYDPPVSGLPYVTADCPNAGPAAKKQISLPCHRGMSLRDVEVVCEAVQSF